MEEERRAVVALVHYQEKILLVKKKEKLDAYLSGLWHIPGETLEEGERDEGGLQRGIREEAGIEIQIEKYLAHMRMPHKNTRVHWYLCEAVTCNLQPGSDVEDAQWVQRDKVPQLCHKKGKALWPREVWEYFDYKG